MRGPHYRRRSPPLLLAAVALWAGLAADAAAQGNAASDRAALEALYDATGGPGWTDRTNWNTSAPPGEWFGVTTDAAGRVTRLELPGNGLTGPVPSSLGSLTRLRSLRLNLNDLTGPVPAELGNLANFEWLDLSANALTGPVPAWLGNLTGLRALFLWENELTGPVPAELGNLANLESLNLGSNELTGPVPAWLGNLTGLWSLDLSGNAFTGPIPDELGRLANLGRLDLSYNWGLSGPLPSGLETRLRWLDIFVSRTCAPGAWQEWLATIEFYGPLGAAGTDVTIDVAVIYTPAIRPPRVRRRAAAARSRRRSTS